MNTSTRPLSIRQPDVTTLSDYVAFPHRDARGRSVGALVRKGIRTYTPVPEGFNERAAWYHEPGVFFFGQVQAARNGQQYGASQNYHSFTTEAERDAWVEKRLADSLKAAAKLAAKAVRS